MARPYRGIAAYVGLNGSGKSYLLAERALQEMKDGRKVWSNMPIRGAERIRSFEEMLVVPGNSTLILDEAPTMFNARKWAEFPDALLHKFTQLRKDEVRLFYSAVDVEMVDTNLRRLTFDVFECSHLMGKIHRCRRYRMRDYGRAKAKPSGKWNYRLKREVMDAYDTQFKVAIRKSQLDKIRKQEADEWIDIEPGETLRDLLDRVYGSEEPAWVAPFLARGRVGRSMGKPTTDSGKGVTTGRPLTSSSEVTVGSQNGA